MSSRTFARVSVSTSSRSGRVLRLDETYHASTAAASSARITVTGSHANRGSYCVAFAFPGGVTGVPGCPGTIGGCAVAGGLSFGTPRT